MDFQISAGDRSWAVICTGVLCLALLFTVASPAEAQRKKRKEEKRKQETEQSAPVEAEKVEPNDKKPDPAPNVTGPTVPVEIDLTTVIGQNIPGRVDLLPLAEGQESIHLEVPKGQLEASVPAGSYRAYVYVYDNAVPVLVHVADLEVKAGVGGFLPLNLLEGAGGSLSVRSFDFDGDLAIDRVELDSGTDPYNAASVPGRSVLPYDATVLQEGSRWYRGELYAHSKYGRGTESVGELVSRAEKANLDFLAITDRNTMASIFDPQYASKSVVLIPAMEWGTDQRGVALIYGPRTMPDPPRTVEAAQAECIRVQAQGGVFAIAHPCFPTAPWQWGLSYVNAVQVWARGWRDVPPMALKQLGDVYKEREKLTAEQVANGRKPQLVHSIAAAAADSEIASVSANMQAAKFWDYEMVRGLMAAPIGGSGTASPKVPMGSPVTYIRAREKSLPAIMEGFRQGHVYVSSGVDGPRLTFRADVLGDGRVDVDMGGVIPLNALTIFEVGVSNAEGRKLEVLQNGRPILSKNIEGPGFVTAFEQKPDAPCNYRVRIVGAPVNFRGGFGPNEVFAMSSPIYAQDITAELMAQHPNLDLKDAWVRVSPPEVEEVGLPESEETLRTQPLN